MSSTAAADAVRSVDRLKGLTLENKTVSADVVERITSATIERGIDGASTFSIGVSDSDRTLLKSSLLASNTVAKIDGLAYELVQIRKSGDGLSLVFEDLAIASLRKHDEPMKVNPGTMTHVDFVRRMMREEPWLKLVIPSGVRAPTAKVELTRGNPDDSDAERETTWDAIRRIGGDRGWRAFIRNGDELWYAPETWLADQDPSFDVRERAGGVDNIDFDWDAGKPVATASLQARAARWGIPVGSVVRLRDVGPASGKWLVESISRSVFSLDVSVRLKKPDPELPEPKPQDTSTGEAGESGYSPGSSSTSNDGSSAGRASSQVETMVNAALSQRGKPYVWGGKTPAGWDCSGLVTYATGRAGARLSGASATQYSTARSRGRLISVSQAMNTRGALLFRIGTNPNHVAISLGNGQTIEARGRAYGVGTFGARGRPWTHGALVPGLSY